MARRHPTLIPLSHDHREALGLAFRLHHPAPPGPVTLMTPASTAASRAAETLAFHDDRLRPHFDTEETVLFPALRTAHPPAGAVPGLLDRLLEEHREMTRLRDEVATAGGDALEDVLRRFADLLETHVRTEERELFARFPGPLSEAAACALGARIRALRTDRR
jgi:hypothetical protein